MLIKNQIYEAEISDYTSEGQGVAKIEGCAVFIPNAIFGERVRVRIEKAQKTWATGKIVEILDRSPHRVNRDCPVAKLCGGCHFQHMDYAEETRLKAERVRNCLNRIGGESLDRLPILSAPTCQGYRNKAQYPVSSHKNRAFAGFFRSGTHHVIENDRCLILPEEMDGVKNIVIDHMNQFRIPAYDETTHTGLVRHIYVRRGAVSKQVLVCLVTNGRSLPHAGALIEALKAIPGFTSFVLSVNTKKGNVILGDEFITLYGPGTIEDTLCGLTFRLSPRSFYQVNHYQAQRLYQAAIEQAEITKNDTVLDLYCGVGTITLAMAGAAGKVIGVEVVPQAVEDARENAKRNGIENANFFCGDAGQAALELEKQGIKADVVVVDPPRKGLNADTIEALSRFAPRRIVYVSCDPATLARDVALLKERGYALKNAMAADLFPRCAHVESVICLSREKADDKKWAFFENARLLQEAFGITPLLYGSLGLEYLTGKKLNTDDIDILIPKAYIAELWHEFTSVLEKNGYTLIDEHEHTFEKGGIHYAYAQIEELESFASIRMSEIATLSAGNLRFKLLSLQQYLKVYTASAKDGYRVEVREKKDFDKIAFIEKQLQTTENVAFPPKRMTDESIVCMAREKVVHSMNLNPSPVEMIKRGKKTIELRLFDEKRQKIKTGDDIIFTNAVNGEKMCATVKTLHCFDSFEELYKTLPLLQCGYTAEDIDTAHPSDMEQYYSIEEQNKYGVVGIELFPPKRMTDETIVLLGRKDIHERIKFDVNVEDLHGRASATATYPEIKAYVLEKFGLKVSSLYIAQIKEKCGLDKRENFNIGEGKSRPLICPPEKEQAIMDAFRHFGMIDT